MGYWWYKGSHNFWKCRLEMMDIHHQKNNQLQLEQLFFGKAHRLCQ
jgi:hypothetical protein